MHEHSELVERLDRIYEFDREPVAEENLQSGKYFAGCFAGEHVAATEFVIGALFVSWGASVYDIFIGLLIGNLLAVLSWRFFAAPLGVETRLTLYWYMRRIAGPYATALYNVLNAVLYCILAGSMITVSASAVRIPFNIPAQTNWYPEDFRFVLVVLAVGALVVALAVLGFKRLALFATVCAPWIFAMFIAGALATLPGLAASTPGVGEVHGFGDFWRLADSVIWTGATATGERGIGFWHVAAFAWICNLAMHIGLSDMALFRYARKKSYGYYAAFGMFLGHYLAWIAAGVMGAAAAVAMGRPLAELDSGAVAHYSLGIAGAVAVVIAGWTTSNPTLYRAGLALQAVTPNWPRWKVTIVAGVATTVIACFPFVFTKLLGFVGIYGLLLAPMGAIVFTEHYLFPRLGLTRYWAEGRLLNLPALASWTLGILLAVALWWTDTLHLFFLLIPVWITTSVLYIVFSSMAGARTAEAARPEPRRAARSAHLEPPPRAASPLDQLPPGIALIGLVCCIAWPIWVLVGGAEHYAARMDVMKTWLVVGSVLYFIGGTRWAMRREGRG